MVKLFKKGNATEKAGTQPPPTPHPDRHPASIRALEIDHKASSVDVYGPYSDAMTESQRVERLYGHLTDEYRKALDRAKTRASTLEPLVKDIRKSIVNLLHREEQEAQRLVDRAEAVEKEDETEMEETIKEDELEMDALAAEEEQLVIETKRIDNVHRSNLQRLANHKAACVAEYKNLDAKADEKLESELLELEEALRRETNRIQLHFAEWRLSLEEEGQGQASRKREAASVKKTQKRLPLDDARAALVAKQSLVDKQRKELGKLQASVAEATSAVQTVENQFRAAQETAQQARQEVNRRLGVYQGLLDALQRETQVHELQMAQLEAADKEALATKKLDSQNALKQQLASAQEQFQERNSQLNEMMAKLEALRRQGEEAREKSNGELLQLQAKLEATIRSVPELEAKIEEQLVEEARRVLDIQAIAQAERGKREAEASEAERNATHAHATRVAALDAERSALTQDAENRIVAARSSIEAKTEACIAHYTPLLERQADLKSAARTRLASCLTRRDHVEAEKRSLEQRHSVAVSAQEALSTATTTRDKRLLDELTRLATEAKRALEEAQADLVKRSKTELDALSIEATKLEQDEKTIQHSIQEELQMTRDTSQTNIDALRARYGSKRSELEARRRELQTAFAKTAPEPNRLNGPLDQASLALQSLESELNARSSLLTQEQATLQQYTGEVETRVRLEVDGLTKLVEEVQGEATFRISALKREYEAEAIRLTADRDAHVRELNVKLDVLRNKVSILQDAADKMRDEVLLNKERAENQDKLYETRIKELKRSTLPALEHDVGIADGAAELSLDDRIIHRLATIGILTEQVKQSDIYMPSTSIELEVNKLEMEMSFLQEDVAALEQRRGRVESLYTTRLEAKLAEVQLAEQAIRDDADELRISLERIVDMKKVQLRLTINDLTNVVQTQRAKLTMLREEAQRQTSVLELLAKEAQFEIRRLGVVDELKELRRLDRELAHVSTEEEHALSDLLSIQHQANQKVALSHASKMASLTVRRSDLSSRKQHAERTLVGWQAHVDFLQHVEQDAQRVLESETKRIAADQAARHESDGQEGERYAIGIQALDSLLARVQHDLAEATKSVEDETATLERLEAEYQEKLSHAKEQGSISLIQAWCEAEMARIDASLRASDETLTNDLDQVAEMRLVMERESKRFDELVAEERVQGEGRVLTRRQAVVEAQQRMAQLKIDLVEAAKRHEAESKTNHAAETMTLKDMTGFQESIPAEIVALQQAAEAEFAVREASLRIEEQDLIGRSAARSKAFHDRIAKSQAAHAKEKMSIDELEKKVIKLEDKAIMLEREVAEKRRGQEALVERLTDLQTLADAWPSELQAKEAAIKEAEATFKSSTEAIDKLTDKEIRDVEESRHKAVLMQEKEMAVQLEQLEQSYATKRAQVRNLRDKTCSEHDKAKVEELSALDAEVKREQRDLERMKANLASATTQRAAVRAKKREAQSKRRAELRLASKDEAERASRRYQKEMAAMIKSIEESWGLLLTSLESERTKLGEERENEIRRLELKERQEIDHERKRKEREVQERFQKQRQDARDETEKMRETVLTDLKKMEEDSRNRLLEEMKKLQMLQLMMQQEALTKLDIAVQQKMTEIESNKVQQAEEIERNFRNEQIRLREELLAREQERLMKLAAAWASTREARAVDTRKLVAAGKSHLQQEIRKLEEEEERMFLAEQAKIESEMQRLEEELREAEKMGDRPAKPLSSPTRPLTKSASRRGGGG